jgi:hypothetical protein
MNINIFAGARQARSLFKMNRCAMATMTGSPKVNVTGNRCCGKIRPSQVWIKLNISQVKY